MTTSGRISKGCTDTSQCKESGQVELFLSLLAGRTGQLGNFSSMRGDAGASSTTLAEWFSVLEASNIVFKLTPYIGKRLAKTPKVYFTDTGIPGPLLSITNEERLLKDNLRGHLFENLVILEALKSRYNANKAPSFHFFRTDAGIQIDLVDQRGDELVPYEIKSSDTLVDEFFSNLDKSAVFLKNNLSTAHGGLLYAGSTIPCYKNWRASIRKPVHCSIEHPGFRQETSVFQGDVLAEIVLGQCLQFS